MQNCKLCNAREAAGGNLCDACQLEAAAFFHRIGIAGDADASRLDLNAIGLIVCGLGFALAGCLVMLHNGGAL